MTIKEALILGTKKLNNCEDLEAKNVAKRALAFLLKKDFTYLAIYSEEKLNKEIEYSYMETLSKIEEGMPLQYITHEQNFMGINFCVDENVLIPQPDTEILVKEVLDICKRNNIVKILDMCTGSGAIAISLAKDLKSAKIFASDISKKALKVAKKNAEKESVDVFFIESDLFSKIDEKFDLIVSNPPYIKTEVIKTLDKQVHNEPLIALDGGKDGLLFYRSILNNAKDFLNDNGFIALEIGFDQKDEVISLMKKEGYKNVYSKKDLGNNDRIVVGKK